MSKILKVSPFSPELLNHSEPQLDFIIEMYAAENPKELTATRNGVVRGIAAEITADVAWSDVLIGPARDEWMVRNGLLPPPGFWEKVLAGRK